MYPRGGACTVTVSYPTYGFAAEKDIPQVVSDGEINPNVFLCIAAVCSQIKHFCKNCTRAANERQTTSAFVLTSKP